MNLKTLQKKLSSAASSVLNINNLSNLFLLLGAASIVYACFQASVGVGFAALGVVFIIIAIGLSTEP